MNMKGGAKTMKLKIVGSGGFRVRFAVVKSVKKPDKKAAGMSG